ncbi:hypothetical protein JCM10212_002997 [Sporobolomyces blumeae]
MCASIVDPTPRRRYSASSTALDLPRRMSSSSSSFAAADVSGRTRSAHRPSLPPFSSLSLPPSPRMTTAALDHGNPAPPSSSNLANPWSTSVPRRVSIPSPRRIPPPTQPVGSTTIASPEPEVYAKAYELLLHRWEGRELEILAGTCCLSALSTSSTPATKKRAHGERDVDAQLTGPRRRKSAELVDRADVADEPTKRSRVARDNSVSFFDNPPPSTASSRSTVDEDGFRRPSLPIARRTKSLSPRLRALPAFPRDRSPPVLDESEGAPRLVSRKRSFSQPLAPSSTTPSEDSTRLAPRRSVDVSRATPRGLVVPDSAPVPPSRLPHSCSAPQLALSNPFSSSSSSISTPSFSGSSSSRSEALRNVVQSFEAVLACRAEGWRRLANRKNSWLGSTAAAGLGRQPPVADQSSSPSSSTS